jgi:hypothetical protein
VKVEDAGEYSCEMTEEEEDKIREFVTVAVFERQSEEEMGEGNMMQEEENERQMIKEEEESEEIDFFGTVEVANSKYKNIKHDKKHQRIPGVAIISYVSNSHTGLANTYILILVTCVLYVML